MIIKQYQSIKRAMTAVVNLNYNVTTNIKYDPNQEKVFFF